MKKNTIPILGYLSIVTALTLFLFSCKKNNTDSPANEKQGTAYEYIKKLGYKESDIKDIGKAYLVEGDILFDKKSEYDLSIFRKPKTEQYGTANYVGYYKQYDIQIGVEYPVSAYLPEIQAAADMWNDIPNCRIHFQINHILSGQANNSDSKMTPIPLGYPLVENCGTAFFPKDGLPGEYIYINVNAVSVYSTAQKIRAFAHMMAHAIGIRHTNWQGHEVQSDGYNYDAMHILGTPTGDDPSSLMNRAQCGNGPTTLSNYDILAAQFLYPENPPVAGTVPVFRYFARQTLQDHFYTTEYWELGNGANNNYTFEGIGFFTFPNQVNNSVPVYRYLRTNGIGDHFYTTDPNEVPPSEHHVIIPEGIAFYAYPSPINGSVPVYRYYDISTGDHFYTKNLNEVSFMPGYVSEGIGWYSY